MGEMPGPPGHDPAKGDGSPIMLQLCVAGPGIR